MDDLKFMIIPSYKLQSKLVTICVARCDWHWWGGSVEIWPSLNFLVLVGILVASFDQILFANSDIVASYISSGCFRHSPNIPQSRSSWLGPARPFAIPRCCWKPRRCTRRTRCAHAAIRSKMSDMKRPDASWLFVQVYDVTSSSNLGGGCQFGIFTAKGKMGPFWTSIFFQKGRFKHYRGSTRTWIQTFFVFIVGDPPNLGVWYGCVAKLTGGLLFWIILEHSQVVALHHGLVCPLRKGFFNFI